MYLVCTRITVWLLVESNALDLYARRQSWPSLEFSRPNFSISKTCQGLDVARRRIKRICAWGMYSVAAFSVVPGGHGHPQGLGWNYRGYGRQPRGHAASMKFATPTSKVPWK